MTEEDRSAMSVDVLVQQDARSVTSAQLPHWCHVLVPSRSELLPETGRELIRATMLSLTLLVLAMYWVTLS